jgi:hypothetical protein
MSRSKGTRAAVAQNVRSPSGIAARRRRSAPARNPLDVSPGEHDEFLKKTRAVHALLRAPRILDRSKEAAAAWALAFADEADPTFCVLEWLQAGWRDPELVHVALRVCGTRRDAERAMTLARRAVDEGYDRNAICDLANAMKTLEETHSNDS